MTDDQSARDELASAYMDDALAPAERAHVESDPQLMARVRQLSAVRAMVATAGPAPDADQREAAVRAALQAAQEWTQRAVPLDARRQRARVGLGALAAAAAVVLAVATGVAVTRSDDHPAPQGAAAVPTDAGPVAEATSGAGPSTTIAPRSSATTLTGPSPGTQGTDGAVASARVPSAASGADVIRIVARSGGSAAPTPAGAAVSACPGPPRATYRGRITWQGTPADVFVVDGRAVVVARRGCDVLVTVTLG
jgi:hypothetical protein